MPPKGNKGNLMSVQNPAAQNPDFNLDDIVASLPTAGSGEVSGGGNKTTKAAVHVAIPDDISQYTEISKSAWLNIPTNTYIRYVDQNGKWRPGARLKSIRQAPDGGYAFSIGKFNPGVNKFVGWKVPFSNVATLYKLKNDVGAPTKSKPAKIAVVVPPNISPEVMLQVDNPKQSNEEQILGQLGNKLLFEDGEIIRHKVEGLEAEVHRIGEDLTALVTLIKRVYSRLDKAGVP